VHLGTIFFVKYESRDFSSTNHKRPWTLSNLADSPTITIENVQISQVATAKSLGVTIDNKLDWSSHIDKLTKKIDSGIGAIKRMGPHKAHDGSG